MPTVYMDGTLPHLAFQNSKTQKVRSASERRCVLEPRGIWPGDRGGGERAGAMVGESHGTNYVAEIDEAFLPGIIHGLEACWRGSECGSARRIKVQGNHGSS